jgi:CIC family chloride channel protein
MSQMREYWLGARDERFFLVLAIFIGIFSGLAVVCFRIAIESSRLWLLGPALQPPAARTLLVPTLAGLVIAFLVIRFFPRTRGSGVNQTKAALYIYEGRIPFQTVIGKFLTCSLSIGSGHSLGPEDPSLQIGAGLASAMGRRLRISRERLRLIAPVGAAAGLAAAFNTPITAVLFVIEEVIGRWSAGILGSVVLSAVSSVVIARWFLGNEPLFRVPIYQLTHPGELLAYAALGAIGGLVSLAFVKMVLRARARLATLPAWSQYVQPATAGFAIGVIAMWLPQVMGAGYEFIDLAMHEQYTWKLLVLLVVFKMLATCLSFVSGVPGGLFAPTLFMGAMLGAAVASVERLIFPQLPVPVGAYALVGMGTLFAGILRAPITSVFMILEVSGNYSIILPVMISNTIAYLLSRSLQPTPIFDELSRQDGLHLPSMEEQREASILRVEDAMRPPLALTLRGEESAAEAWRRAEESPGESFLVNHGLGAWSVFPRQRLQQLAAEENGQRALNLAPGLRFLPRLHPDNTLDVALRLMDTWPMLPVVHRADFQQLVGVISLDDIVRAYREAGAGGSALVSSQ